VFAVATLLVGLPGVTFTVGTSTAQRIVADPDAFTRVLVWPEANSTPTGYVLAHQDGERLYLVLLTTHFDVGTNSTIKYHTASTALLTDFARVEFIPAGIEIERFRLEPSIAERT
jgi:hypothetical protein